MQKVGYSLDIFTIFSRHLYLEGKDWIIILSILLTLRGIDLFYS